MTLSFDELESIKPTIIAVIGPTNEGKTSVLRTLSGNADFGEVNAYTGTTLRAEVQKFFYKGIEILQLIDTPGFQMSSDILDRLEEREELAESVSIRDILDAVPHDDDFRHDLRAWRETLRCDIGILVVNVMESPSKSLVRDTLRLLALSGKPLMAVFNNVPDKIDPIASGNDFTEQWRNALQNSGVRAMQIYDAHRRNFAHEIELFEKIVEVVPPSPAREVLRLELEERINRENRRLAESRRIIATLLLDAASMEVSRGDVPDDHKEEYEKELLQDLLVRIFEREHAAHLEMLRVWEFRPAILRKRTLNVETIVRRTNDLFGNRALEEIRKGGVIGAGVGAGVGLTLDVMLAGLSFGTGTLIGALIGGTLGGGQRIFRFNYDQGEKRITIKPQKDTILALLSRALDLTNKLQSRGKALEDTEELFLALDSKNTDVPEMEKMFNKPDIPALRRVWDHGMRFFVRGTPQSEVEPLDALLEVLKRLLPSIPFSKK